MIFRCAAVLLVVLVAPGCSGAGSALQPLTAEMPLHVEDHIDAATIVGSEGAVDLPEPLEWRFDEPRPDWQPVTVAFPGVRPLRLDNLVDALRLILDETTNEQGTDLRGGIVVDLPDLLPSDWAYVLVRARASEGVRYFSVGFNTRDPDAVSRPFPYESASEDILVVNDGTVQTYLAPVEPRVSRGPWQRFGIWVYASEPATFDVLSIAIVPAEAEYSSEAAGVKSVARSREYRNTLYTHAPGQLQVPVLIPAGGRLDVGLGVVREDTPVTFRIRVDPGVGGDRTLFEKTWADPTAWDQSVIDLSALEGEQATLILETDAGRTGTVALWGAPTISGVPTASGAPTADGARTTERPNVIFYVIDGAGADYLSVYGYNRRTTPTLERLAAEGTLFEHAYSNADWTRPSTASFMTSLYHGVLGGFRAGFNVIPEGVPTMAQHMHRAGYQTAVFTANPNAGRMSGLERGVDRFREDWETFSYGMGTGDFKESSRYLHEAFWEWREEYPAEPYWAHFQTVDVHQEVPANPPFSGLFVSPGQVNTWRDWDTRLRREEGSHGVYSPAYEKTGIDRVEFFTLHQGLHDENMAHNDFQLGRLVERLRATGEWENTLLIVGSDHSITAAMDDMGIALLEDLPPRWSNPSFRPSITRVPLLFVWPGRIPGGQRLEQTVSMIDVLPTILDLLRLPMPEVVQGQSLAPLLLGTDGWEKRPVIIEQLNADGLVRDEYSRIGVVDGRWGASLEIRPAPEPPPGGLRPVPLLLYDLWNDPLCLYSLHEERPDLVEKYTEFLESRFAAHQALAQRFTPAGEVPLTPEQLRTLRALGYIQ